MDNMNIDRFIDIPDTPDRVSTCHVNGREGSGKESVSSVANYSRKFCLFDEECCNQLGDTGRVVPESGKIMTHHMHPQITSNGEMKNINGLRTSGNAPLFRRTVVEKDKGKAICTKFPSKSSCNPHNDSVINLNQRNVHNHLIEMAHPHEGSKRVRMTHGDFSSCGTQNSFRTDGNSRKGKEKMDDNTCKASGPATDRERNDLSRDPKCKNEDLVSSSDRPIIRVPGHRRLVKNGCISPHGIAARAKQLAENNQSSSKDTVTERSYIGKAASSNPSQIGIRDIVAEDNIIGRAKGKGATMHPHTSKDDDAKITDFSCRNGSRSTYGSDGWRSTHNQKKKRTRPLSNRSDCSLRMGTQRTSSLLPKTEQTSEHGHTDRTLAKRQWKNGFTSAVSDEQEKSVVGSSRESSSSRPSRVQNHQPRGMLNPVFEIDDSSPEVRPSCSEGTRLAENDESEARVRQVEADEILARELQEQLYQDSPLFGDDEINENIAWALQQEENSLRASSSQNHRLSHPISSVSSSHRQTRSRLLQNSSNRRPNSPRANASGRMLRTRENSFGQSSEGFPRPWNFHFPSNMALESRLDVLEELEAAVEELSGSMSRTSRLLQLERDFNENDYEMLLALDENNHCHGGASVNQINHLPQSTVQTDNFEEACAICLEIPTKGDIIRHLPCLHKYHKDCIDPWLGRSKSCPVCKSSVT